MNTTLPTDSQARKEIPIVSGCLDYFPAALCGVARVSKAGNDRHNPGEPLHHTRGKSTDHADCIVRHLIDLQGLLAAYTRRREENAYDGETDEILAESSALAWRALALSQELHERFGAPLAPGARLPMPIVDVRAELAEPVAEFDGSKRVVLPTPSPFRIEAGKRYVRRNGVVTDVIELAKGGITKNYPNHTLCDPSTGYTYRPDGSFSPGADENPDDLIAEYVGPESED